MTTPARWRRLGMALAAGAVLAAGALFAAGPASAQQLPLRVFGQLDGLTNLSVSAIVQDRSGYLWVGTDNGLYRFDGARFQRQAVGADASDTGIAALHLDPAGRLWVGTEHGVFRLDGTRLVEVRRGDGKPLPVRAGQHFASLDAGRLLVQSNGRLYRVDADGAGGWRARDWFSAQQMAQLPMLRDLDAILLEADGTLWLGCDVKLCRHRGGVLAVLGEADGVPRRRWYSLMRHRDGALWLGGPDKVVVLAAGQARFRDHSPPGFVARDTGLTAPLLQDADGRVISLSDNGLFRRGASGWQRFGERNGLRVAAGNHALLMDQGGDLWLGLPGRGLVQWKGYRHWENWTRQQGLPDDEIWSLLRTSDGVLRAATGAGMSALGAGGFGAAPGGGAGDAPLWGAQAEDRHGNLWRGSFAGMLERRDRAGRTTLAMRVGSRAIFKLLFDDDGRLWIATDSGLHVMADPQRAPVALPVDPVLALLGPDADFTDACKDARGRLWFVGMPGLLLLEAGRWSRPPVARPRRGFSHVACDGDTLWLAEANGARVWRADTLRRPLRLRPVEHALLAGRLLHSMLVDRRHWLWLGTDTGVVAWNGQRWRLFNEQSGLVWNDANQNAIYEDHDGSIWIGTSNGLSHLLRPESVFTPGAVPLHVGAARYGGGALGGAAPWNGGTLDVRLTAPLLQNHEALSYRYRLLGQEQAWSRSDNGELRYAALAPGEYRLQVVAEHATSQTSSAMLELPLTITPPWWRTRWAYAGAALLALGAIGLLHRYRVARVLRQRALLERRVAERTAELEASREEHRLRSLKDGLTKAWNRTALMERLAALTAPGAGPFLLVLLDLDHFKKVNDTQGHLAGDEVLREMVRRIQARLRASDTVGRYGGEEFMLLLPGLDLAGGARRLAQLHREVCAAPVDIDGFGPLPVTCSGGVVVGRADLQLTAEQWIALADQALYRAKALGRNRLEYAPEAGLA